MKDLNELYNPKNNQIEQKIEEDIDENILIFEALFRNCDDVVKKKFQIGDKEPVWGYISYIDVMVDRKVIEISVLEKIIEQIKDSSKQVSTSKEDLFELIKNYVIATADVKEIATFDEVSKAVLSGDTILLIDGYEKGLLISTRGWPNRGIQEPDTEVVVRGSKDGFSESIRFNTVLVRRRIRDTKLKILQKEVGTRSRTDIAILYMDDIVRKEALREIETRLRGFSVDAVFDSGMLEELIENGWRSPFPQIQATQRPDKVASALLEGRIAIVVDNSPYVLLLPTTFNSFFQSPEDYYDNWIVISLVRILRYVAVIMAVSVPGLYIALIGFHPAMIPSGLVFSISAAREGVPFPGLVELLIMEFAFELLREAGIRLPGAIGNTIGIVGGIIIGQAAVEANIVSPIVVIIVALTAIASYTVPSYTMTGAYRVTKYFIILMSAVLGLYGFWLGMLVILIHLIGLQSLGYPYLMPFVAGDLNSYNDLKDTFFRLPMIFHRKRPVFALKKERVKVKFKKRRGD